MDDVEDIVRNAIRDVKVSGPQGARSLAYYAGVGIDHFHHDFDNLQVLIDMIANEVASAIRSQPPLPTEGR